MRDDEEEEEKGKKMNKIETFRFDFLQLDKVSGTIRLHLALE